MFEIVNFEDDSITNTQDETEYINSLCKETNKVLHKVCKSYPDIIRNSPFVFADRSMSTFGINTEAWHCITISSNSILSLELNVRAIICELIISNIYYLIDKFEKVDKVIESNGNL
jgi:hypothetical protein